MRSLGVECQNIFEIFTNNDKISKEVFNFEYTFFI